MPESVHAAGKPKLLTASRIVESFAHPPADVYDFVRPWEGADLAVEGRGVRVALTAGFERMDAAFFESLPDLELVAVIAAGHAGIDLEAARRHGVAVTNAGAINSPDVAEYAVTMMLAFRREVVANHQWVLDDRWFKARRQPVRSIAGERVGIVGLGNIGLEVGKRLEPFGCEISWWSPRPKEGAPWPYMPTLRELAEWSTTLVVACRGSDETTGLITAEIIDAVGPGGLIVNVSRGFVIGRGGDDRGAPRRSPRRRRAGRDAGGARADRRPGATSRTSSCRRMWRVPRATRSRR